MRVVRMSAPPRDLLRAMLPQLAAKVLIAPMSADERLELMHQQKTRMPVLLLYSLALLRQPNQFLQ